MKRCLYCYSELENNDTDFHRRCAKKIFGSDTAPILPYTKTEIKSLAERVVLSHVTLTGVQAKLSMDIAPSQQNEAKRFTIVGLWGRYILKPQTEHFNSLPEVEDLTMHLAEIAKIKTVPHSLIRFSDGTLAYITKRIDRGPSGQKIAMEDMCQLAERLTEYKYRGSYEQIAKLITKYSSVAKLDLVNFWEQVVFSYLTGNADMHLKNFSLYSIRKGQPSLTPCYDMVSTWLVIPEDTEEMALTLNGKKRKLKRIDFETAMKSSGLDEKVIKNIFAKFSKVYDKWVQFIDISFLPEEMKHRYKEIIQQKAAIILS